MKKIIALTVFLFSIGLCYSQQYARTADSLRKYRNVPGMVYAVFNTDQILDSACLGNKRMRVKDPVKWNNRFMVVSTTTVFTSYIAARLVEEGKISWKTSIIKAFPDMDGKIIKLYQKITLEQLLSQRVGLPELMEYTDRINLHSWPGTPQQQREAFTLMMLKKKPKLIMDSTKEASFSLVGVAIAASMMERITKKSWETLVADYISKPLRIDIQFGYPALKDSTQPWGHWDYYSNLTSHKEEWWSTFFTPIAPVGNININMNDFITFGRDHLLAYKQKKALISTNSAKQLLVGKPVFAEGWANSDWNGLEVAYFSGRGGLYSSYIELIPEKGIGIIVLCNSGSVDGRSVCINLGHQLREYYVH